jgi:hypothetical protein
MSRKSLFQGNDLSIDILYLICANLDILVPTYFLLQPNDKYAVFSKLINKTTSSKMTEAEALEYGAARWEQAAAEQMIAEALDDAPLDEPWEVDHSSNRWRSGLT